VHRFLKEQHVQLQNTKERDQANLEKTVQVFQEQIQTSRHEVELIKSENEALKAANQKVIDKSAQTHL
jgi:hypothetical protein